MSSYTQHLDLLKKDPVADASDTFNIDTMLNDNWDKVDAFAGAVIIPHVGDLITRVSPAPDASWLPCDGRIFNRNDYPMLAAILPRGYGTTPLGASRAAYDGNNTIVAIGPTYARYSTDKGITWNTLTVGETTANYQDVCYGGGKWVIIGNDTTDNCCVWVADSATGSWTKNASGLTGAGLTRIAYGNGTWKAFGCLSHSAYVVCGSSSNPLGNWTLVNAGPRRGGGTVFSIDCGYFDSGWAVWMSEGSGSSTYCNIFWYDSISGTWSTTFSAFIGLQILQCALGYNGQQFVLVVTSNANSTESGRVYVAETTEFSSDDVVLESADLHGTLTDIRYAAGKWWLLTGGSTVYTAALPANLDHAEKLAGAVSAGIPIGAEDWTFIGNVAATTLARNLPNVISSDGLTATFVKAEEVNVEEEAVG